MAIENAINCFFPTNIWSINFNNNVINVGEFWYCSNSLDPMAADKVLCAEITLNTDEPTSQFSAVTQYSNCYDCWSNNYGLFVFESCSGSFRFPLVIDVSALTEPFFSTFIDGTYYIECEVNGFPVSGCFFTKEPFLPTLKQYEEIEFELQNFGADIVRGVVGITAFTGCQECLLNSPVIYEVSNCAIDGQTDYVQLPNNSFVLNDLISYTDGIDEFCGVIAGLSESSVPEYTFVSYYGNDVRCDDCLEQANNKYLITNCVDSNIQQVVWGSQLFQNGSVSNLQFGGGCYEVSGQTTDPVTLNLFLDFEPQPTCTSCLECNGIIYEYAYCDEPTVKVGEVLSYQIIPVGSVFYHPNEDLYVLRLNAIPQPIVGINFTLYSAIIGNDCLSVVPPVGVWNANICGTDIQISLTIIGGVGNVGEIRQVLWGENELFCVELIREGSFNTNSFVSTSIVYNSCEECASGTTIGLRTVNCYTQEIEVIDLSYSAWTQVTNYANFSDFTPFNCLLDSNGYCRTFPEICPVTPVGNLVGLNDQYLNCPICIALNPEPPNMTFSAGTEYLVCNICDDCCGSGATSTSIVPPHPTWTRPDGNAVVLLDAVSLGGMFGLNS
jgi:hypothetical protein